MDNLTIRRPQDPLKINVHEDWEVRYWSKAFNVTPEALKAAVRAVGVKTADVKRYLGR